MSSESYKTLIDLQADIKSFENSVDSHYLNYYNLYNLRTIIYWYTNTCSIRCNI